MVEPDATAPPLEVAPEEQPPAAAATQQEPPTAAEHEGDHKRKLEAGTEANGAGEDAKRPRVEGDGAGVSQNNESSEKVEEPAAASTEGAVDAENGKVAPPIEDLQTGSEDKPAEPAMEAVAEAPQQEGGTPGVPQETSRKIDVPNDKVGVLIGKAGETIRNLQMNSGTKIQITKDADADANAPTRFVELVGTLESIDKAEQLIKNVIAESEAGGSPALIARGFGSGQSGSEQFEISYTDVSRIRKPRDNCYTEVSRAGRARSVVSNWEGRDQSPSYEEPTTDNSASVAPRGRLYSSRGSNQAAETPTIVSDEDVLSVLMEQHDLFLSSTRSRLTKLQIVHQMWERNDVKGVIAAMDKMSDHAVSADMASVLMEKSETITLDLCTSLLPVLTDLLESKTDRHLGVSLELLVKFVRTFGPVIHSTVSAGPSSVGVDLQAEQRRERCNLCFIELEKVKNKLPFLTRPNLGFPLPDHAAEAAPMLPCARSLLRRRGLALLRGCAEGECGRRTLPENLGGCN